MKLFFSSTTTKPTTKKSIQTTKSHKLEPPLNTSYYDQFLKATTPNPKTTTVDINSSTWFELVPTGAINLSTVWPEDEWETINPNENDSPSENLEDVEILFDNTNSSGVSVTIDFDCQQKRIVSQSISMKMKGMTKFVVSVLTVFLLNYIKVICCHHRTHSREYV